ncbi:hypothetical protein FRC01_005319, partial [Tulasnella sp. 417]
RDDAVTDGSIAEPDIHEVVPGEQPDFAPTPTSTLTSGAPTTTSHTSTSVSSPPSTSTVEPYTMTFEVSNIPPGWQKSGRTSFYSKNIIIGFSVTLAALICLTIVLCVIWRIRVARERRESERALKEKKREMGLSSQTSDDSSSLYRDETRETTRQRGLRRRRANVRVGDEDDDDDGGGGGDHDDHDTGLEQATSERNGMTPSVTGGRKRRTAFMRTFSGKMLTAPIKWKVNRRRRQQQEEQQEEEEEQEDREDRAAEVEEVDGEGERSVPRRRDTVASRTSVSPATASQTAVEPSIPDSPPPPPPVSLQPHHSTSITSTPHDAHPEDEDDDDDPTAIQPPAYRRRNFGIRSRTRPTTAPTSTPMSPRALEKQREAEGSGAPEDVPEEYMYLAGMMPPPVRSTTTTTAPAATNQRGLVLERSRVVPPVEQDRDDEEDDDAEEDDHDVEGDGEPRRADVTAHLATDDKTVLARLHQGGSAPSAPPTLDSAEDEDLRAVVPQEEEVYELEGSGPSGHFLPPPPSPPPSTMMLPAPPAITAAHLFLPPPPPHEGSDLPRYVAGPSAPSLLGSEKLSVLPSAPEDLAVPAVLPSAPPAETAVVPSAPPMLEDGEVHRELGLAVPSAPPMLEDESDANAGPSAPGRAA